MLLMFLSCPTWAHSYGNKKYCIVLYRRQIGREEPLIFPRVSGNVHEWPGRRILKLLDRSYYSLCFTIHIIIK